MIREDDAVATRADIQSVQEIAQTKLRQLEQQQGQALRQHRWVEAKALSGPIAEQRSWLMDLTRYGSTLDGGETAASRTPEWRRMRELLFAEYDVTLSAALAKLTPEAYERADAAWRTLVSFMADALDATQDEQLFHALSRPAPPSSEPNLERWARASRRDLSGRPAINKARWQHLLP